MSTQKPAPQGTTMNWFNQNFNRGQHRLEEPALLRAAATCLALFSFLFPWVTLDGSSSTTSGAELIALGFTGPEATLMLDVALFPTMVLFAVPIITAPVTVYSALRTLSHNYPLAPPALCLALTILFVLFTGATTSSDTPQLFGIPLPGYGLFLYMVIQAFLIAHTIFTTYGTPLGTGQTDDS